MSWELILLLAAITYGSRAAALLLLPSLPHRLRVVLDRMPSALFAGLAAHSLVQPGLGLVEMPILAATAGAVVAAPLRSLPICLLSGVAAYLLWSTLP